MARTSRLVALAGLCWLAAVPGAAADPIIVTSGVLTAVRPIEPGGMASLTGTRGFSLDAKVSVFEGTIGVLTNCDVCLPGAPLSIAGILSTTVFTGVATLDGNTYTDLSGFTSESSYFYMEFFGNAVLPAFQNTDTTVTLPFRMEGVFGTPGMTDVLRGQGLATVLLRPQLIFGEAPQWRGESVKYDFGNQATVPEPSTMILVGGGLLAIARRFRRSRERNAEC